jgi:cytochrome b561
MVKIPPPARGWEMVEVRIGVVILLVAVVRPGWQMREYAPPGAREMVRVIIGSP